MDTLGELKKEGFHQLLSLDKDITMSSWGHTIKGWWRRGDIKVTKCKKIVECWVKSPANVPREAQIDTKTALLAPQQNYEKITTPSTWPGQRRRID
jgi:hypothetical protein